MISWFSKVFPVGEWAHIQDMFGNVSIRLGAPEGMMLISERLADGSGERLYASFPNPDMASVFEGFEPVAEAELPAKASLLVGNQTAFEKRFVYRSH